MFCKKCGKELPDGVKFCTNCGAPTEDAQQTNGGDQTVYTGTVNGNGPKKRNIGVCILLSIVTCGIYGIVWVVQMVDELNAAANEPNATSGITVFLLSLVTCDIYGLYWLYKAGQQVNRAKTARGMTVDSNISILYLILGIFGLSIVSYALLQNELNQLA